MGSIDDALPGWFDEEELDDDLTPGTPLPEDYALGLWRRRQWWGAIGDPAEAVKADRALLKLATDGQTIRRARKRGGAVKRALAYGDAMDAELTLIARELYERNGRRFGYGSTTKIRNACTKGFPTDERIRRIKRAIEAER